jgi:hypothetical protein
MTNSCKRLHSCWTVAGVLMAVLASSSCSRMHPSNYRFETQPRNVLAEAGIPSAKDPKLALSSSGAVHLLAVYGEEGQSQLGMAISHDGGDTIAPPVPISEKAAQVSSHGENSPSLIVRPTEYYALWEQLADHGGTNLMFARSMTFGHSFEKPIRVTDKLQPSFNGFSSLGVASNGDVYAVWLDARDGAQPPGTFAVYLAKSVDRGATFGRNLRVSLGACPCCRPVVTFGSSDEVHVAWRHVFPGDIRDMVISTSYDNGASFSPPVRVAVDNWRVAGCPHTGPAIAHNGNRLYLAWYTEGSDGKAGIKLAWSEDGARRFHPAVIASGKTLDANHPALSAAADGTVLLAFQARDPVQKEGWSPLQAYLVEITDTTRISDPIPIPRGQKAVSYPAVAAGSMGRVYIAWTEPDSKGNQIRLSRGRLRTSG